MIFGFQFYMFQVRYAVVGKTRAEVEACAQKENGKFLVLENKDAAIEALGPNELKMLYTFFAGKELKPFPRYLAEVYPRVRNVFDEKRLTPAKGFTIPPWTDEEEPLPVRSKKMQKRADALTEINKGAKAYTPERTPDDDLPKGTKESNSASEDTQNEDTDMATKKSAKKSASKKTAAKKAPAKKAATNGAKRGRAARYADTQKIKSTEKENNCLKEFKGKPTTIWKAVDIIQKHPNITFGDYVKKGGNIANLATLERRKQVTISK